MNNPLKNEKQTLMESLIRVYELNNAPNFKVSENKANIKHTHTENVY